MLCYMQIEDNATFEERLIGDALDRVSSPVEIVLAQIAHAGAVGAHFGHLHGVI